MRRLEYIGDGSEKFWEGTQEGTDVTVSWGRIGTAGQSKVKQFADAGTAAAFLTKQIAEKVKKGYTDAGSPVCATPPAPPVLRLVPDLPAPEPDSPEPDSQWTDSQWPDEDTFDPAPGVVRMAFPRRDQARPKRRPDPEAVQTIAGLVAKHRDALKQVVDNRSSDQPIVDAVQRYQSGSPDPLGAAAVATVLTTNVTYSDYDLLDRLGRAWLTEHGLLFAVEAAMALPTIATAERGRQGVQLLRYTAEEEGLPWRWPGQYTLGEVRAAVAAATDEKYAAVLQRLTALRTGNKTKLIASFLAPTETAWIAELEPSRDERERQAPWLYLCVVHTPEQLAAADGGSYELLYHSRVLPTVVRTVGPGAAPTLLDWTEKSDADAVRRVLAAVVEMPTDEAFRELLVRVDRPHYKPAVQAAMQRYPVRATRILATAVAEEPAGTSWLPLAKELLRVHLIALPALRTDVVPTLPPAARDAAEATQAGMVRLPDAPTELLPHVLASPPWTRTRKQQTRVVLPDLVVPVETKVEWGPGELEEARAAADRCRWRTFKPAAIDWKDQFRRGDNGRYQSGPMLVQGPEKFVRPRLATWRVDCYDIASWGPALLGKYGTAAVELIIRSLSTGITSDGLWALLPVLSTDTATLVARALTRLKSARAAARAWLVRHGVAAVPYLVTPAFGAAGKAREEAENALRVIAAHTGVEPVVAEVKRLAGAQAADGLAAMLGTDPLELLPKKLPVPGAWAQPAVLPQLRLRDKDFALSAAATADVLTMFALGEPDEPYGGVALVAQACDPASLAEFGWQVFEQWRAAGMPSKDGWALIALGALGDDETVRRLSPVIRAWPGEGGHARAVTGLDVLAEIGTDVALMHLNGIAQKVKFGGLKQRARDRIELVALNLGLTAAQLADRLVPDLGLAEDGTLVLDYGTRKFIVGFDEQLRPFVSDEDGKRRKALPKPGAKDDAEQATEAYQRFSGLKKDVRTLASDQIARLELAMVNGRRWSGADFAAYFAGHPLLWHVVRRLVWGVYDESGALTGSFRLAEDRTLADVEDETYTVPEGATVGVAHPLHLGDALASWSEMFADYEILQPFQQLGRPLMALTDLERKGARLARFEKIKVPIGKVLGLTKRGWERTAPQDGGVEPGIVKPLPDGRFAVLSLEEGIVAGDPALLGDEQNISGIFLSPDHDGYWYGHDDGISLSTLDAVSASELLADLTELVSGGAK